MPRPVPNAATREECHAHTYTLVYSNAGPIVATGVLITDVVPVGQIGNLSYASSGAAIMPVGTVSYTWRVADLAPGAGGVITITGVVRPGLSGVFGLTNQATIASSVGDTNPANNTSTAANTIDAEPPIPPALLSPPNDTFTNTTSLTLGWQISPSPDVAGYRVDFHGTVVDMGDVTQYNTGVLADGTYTWTVAAYDVLGNVGAYAAVWSFTVDTVSPIIVAVSPANGAIEVDIATSVVITFSRPMNAATLSYTVAPDPGAWSVAWSAGGTVATLTHDPFTYLRTYTVTITMAEDLLGNPLAGVPYVWQFTTAPARLYLPLALRGYESLLPWPTKQ